MLIVKIAAEPNGARANQMVGGYLVNVPEGWAAVPEALESAACGALPWLDIEVENGLICAVSENTAAKELWEAEIAAASTENPDETPSGDGNNGVEVG